MRLTGVIATVVVFAFAAAGCSGTSERNKIDYKSAKSLPPLDVPPDLVTPQSSERYLLLDKDGATYSNYTRERDAARGGEQVQVLPKQEGMRVEEAGDFRWLVVDAEPQAIWQPLREFWQENGFLLARMSPETGVMETDWAENRAKVANSWLRRAFSFVGADKAFSSAERDKFIARVERGEEPGTSEVFITHRGVYQNVARDGTITRTIWQVRPRDPELEAEMLYLLMARFGATQTQIEQARVMPEPPPRAELASGADDLNYLQLRDSFDRAWRKVGLALDYIGFTVQDRDRSQGVYFVRYNDPDAEVGRKGMAKLAFWRDAEPVNQKFQIRVTGVAETASEVHILDEAGTVLATPTASRILTLLRDQLK